MEEEDDAADFTARVDPTEWDVEAPALPATEQEQEQDPSSSTSSSSLRPPEARPEATAAGVRGGLPPACYAQRLLVHPEDVVHAVPRLLARWVVRAANAFSEDAETDAGLTPGAERATADVLSFYWTALLGTWMALTWLFLLTDADEWCGVGARVPRWLESWWASAAKTRAGEGGVAVPLLYVLRVVREQLYPRVSEWAGARPSWVFLATFLSCGLLVSTTPTATLWWLGAWVLLPASFLDAYLASQRLPSGAMEVARDPVAALERAARRVLTPASAQYLRMGMLAFVLFALWLPLLLGWMIVAFSAVGFFGIPACTPPGRSTLSALRAMLGAHHGRVGRALALLFLSVCFLGCRRTIQTVEHPPALALLLIVQGMVVLWLALTALLGTE